MRFLMVVRALLLAACASDSDDETAGWTAQRLYGEAKDAMSSKDWPRAIKYL
jgi:outer membrane protein assembly factor BamD